MKNNKSLLFLVIVFGIGVVLVLILIITSLFSPSPTPLDENSPLPTSVRNTTNPQDVSSFEFTPLQRTVIGQTKDDTVKKTQKVISEREEGDVKIYTVQSFIKQYTNEIRTKNGVVIFETTRTEIATPPPPKLNTFEELYGEPELVLNSVSELGKHVSAYIYASRGFTLFANRYTKTVYDIHRYLPMSLTEYQKEYSRFLQPAPSYPQERPDAAN